MVVHLEGHPASTSVYPVAGNVELICCWPPQVQDWPSLRATTAWEEFISFLDYDVEIRKVICSTNAIESLNARYRRAVGARGHFPSSRPP